VQKPAALAFAEATLARVVSFEARLAAAQRPQDPFGDVVTTFFAFAVVARHGEERRCVLHLNPANVRGLGHHVAGVLFFDLEAQALELGNLTLEARCFVFAAAPFAGALGSFTKSSMVHEFLEGLAEPDGG
jgi:hypothetical protein